MFLKNLHTFPPSNFISLVPSSRPRNANHLFYYCLRSGLMKVQWFVESLNAPRNPRKTISRLEPKEMCYSSYKKNQQQLMQDSCILSHIDELENSSGFIAENEQLMTPNKHTNRTWITRNHWQGRKHDHNGLFARMAVMMINGFRSFTLGGLHVSRKM